MLLGLNRRRAAGRLRAETERQAGQHAAEIAEYEQGKARWAESEAERIATAPRWLQVAAHEEVSRLDVFGGTGLGRQNMVTGLGWELLEQRAVIVLDLTQDRVAGELLTAARARRDLLPGLRAPGRPGGDPAARRAARGADRVPDRRGGARRRRERDRGRPGHGPDDPQEDRWRARRRRLHGTAAHGPDRAARRSAVTGRCRARQRLTDRGRAGGPRHALRRRLPAAGHGEPGPARGRGRAAHGARHRRARPPAGQAHLPVARRGAARRGGRPDRRPGRPVGHPAPSRPRPAAGQVPRSSWRARTSSRPGTWDGSPRCANGTTSPWSGPSPG